ncbi:MAG: cupin domain-containing protein [Pseudomonadota bacterium]
MTSKAPASGVHVIRAADVENAGGRSKMFEGAATGAGVSFFLVDTDTGEGPALHSHPYPETWIVRSGRARFTADGRDIEAGPGDIIVVGAGIAHCFECISEEPVEIVCIHAAERFETTWLDGREESI